jgi:hypothetical protein
MQAFFSIEAQKHKESKNSPATRAAPAAKRAPANFMMRIMSNRKR